jgi:hypothetical protein
MREYRFAPSQQEIPTEEIYADILRVWLTLGRKPSRREYDRLGRFGKSTVEKRFGTWTEAVEMAALFGQGAEREALEVWNALLGHTYDNPILSREISAKVGIREADVRRAVASLVLHYKKPIGSRLAGERRGFYILITEEDFRREVAVLDSRIRHIAWRMAALKRMKPSEVLRDLFADIDEREPLMED